MRQLLTPGAVAGVTATAFLMTVTACRARASAGGKCPVPDQLLCSGTDRALLCEPAGPASAAAWVEVPCKGAHGCARRSDADECDDTVAAPGDACPLSPPLDYACSADGTQALVCNEGRYDLWRACRGPDQCKVEGGRNVRCDTTLGAPGDPCGQQGTYACSTDSASMLVCDGTGLITASTCRGPAGCHIERDTRKVDCDDSLVEEGDPCDRPRQIACAVDRKAELVCQGNKYAKKRECRRGDCHLDGSHLYCE